MSTDKMDSTVFKFKFSFTDSIYVEDIKILLSTSTNIVINFCAREDF